MDVNTCVAIIGAASLLASVINILIAGKINQLSVNNLNEARAAREQATGAVILARDLMKRNQ